MKDEVTRILRLVSEGKLSPEDASELIDAFQEDKRTTQAATGNPYEDTSTGHGSTESTTEQASAAEGDKPHGSKDPFKGFVDFLEGVERDISQNVDWKNIANQVRQGAAKGVEAIKKAADDVKAGNLNLFYASETREVVLPLTVDAGKTLKIENPSGSIKVITGGTESRVTAKAKIRGNTMDEAMDRAEAFTVMIEDSDHNVQIRQPRQTAILVDFLVELATGCALDVKTESGDVSIAGTGSNVKAHTQSGDLHISGASGLIELSVQSGDTHVENSTPTALNLECKSGDISLSNIDGNINARAASGDISIKNWKGKTLAVESVSGDVQADFAGPVTGQVTIRTVNGNSKLELSGEDDCRVSLSTIRGMVKCDLILNDENRSDPMVTGRLGEGTGSLEVSGINGDITVKMKGQPVTEPAP